MDGGNCEFGDIRNVGVVAMVIDYESGRSTRGATAMCAARNFFLM